MKCLLIFADAALSQSYYAGGATRYVQAFEALKLLGYEVHVLRLLSEGNRTRILEYEREFRNVYAPHHSAVSSWRDVVFNYIGRERSWIERVINPIEYAFPEIEQLRHTFVQQIDDVNPDFVIAEMLPAGAVMATLPMKVPWIYGHHDWRYRLRMRRLVHEGKANVRARLTQWALKRGEHEIVLRANGVIAASTSEAIEVQKLGVTNCVTIPVTYDSVAPPSDHDAPQPMRIVHLGSLDVGSTNVNALSEYTEKVLPHLPKSWEFHVIGSIKNAPTQLIQQLRAAGAKILGFTHDLGSVLRPYDVAVLPYGENTGERTRVALLLNYAQVVVSMRAAVIGSTYLRSQENCILVSSLSEFPEKLIEISQNPLERKRIGLNAKAVFERELTVHAQLSRFKRVIEAMEMHSGNRG